VPPSVDKLNQTPVSFFHSRHPLPHCHRCKITCKCRQRDEPSLPPPPLLPMSQHSFAARDSAGQVPHNAPNCAPSVAVALSLVQSEISPEPESQASCCSKPRQHARRTCCTESEMAEASGAVPVEGGGDDTAKVSKKPNSIAHSTAPNSLSDRGHWRECRTRVQV
jgi:hypothetical protein